MSRATTLDAAKAAALLANLPRGELPDHFRTELLVYYVSREDTTDVETARKARRDLLLWLVRTFPQDEILSGPFAIVNASGEKWADPDAIPQLKDAWLSALKDYPKDLLVTEAAVNFFRTVEPTEALQLISEKNNWDIRSNLLGELYAMAGLGVNTAAPLSGVALATSSPSLEPTGLAASFRQALLESTDLKLVLSAVDTTTATARQLATSHNLPAGYDDFCQALMRHTRSLYSQTTLDCSLTATANDVSLTRTVPGAEAKALLLKSVKPVYPREAKKKHIVGEVRLLAYIDTQGRVLNLELISGPIELYQPTCDAVRQWQFQPFLLNRKPFNIATEIAVDFNPE
jgi:TonB family protein